MTEHLTQLRLDEATSVSDVLAPDPLIVRLNKVFSWQQSASRWPYYLSRAVPGREYTRDQLVSDIFGGEDRHYKEPEIKGWLSSIYSIHVDRAHAEVTIEGVGLFERIGAVLDKYRITEDGLALAHAYSTDRASTNWMRIFAGILARNDVRVRCVLLRLAQSDYLTFRDGASAQAFFLTGKGGALRDQSGAEFPLFDYVKGGNPAHSFTPILQHDPYSALGPFLRTHIESSGICIPEHIELEGGRDFLKVHKEPSANDLRLHFKQALALFRDIGALVYVPHRQGWTLDRERCDSLFEPALVADLFGGAPVSRFLDALRVTYIKFSDPEGLVRVADIRDYVCDELDIPTGERIDYFNQQVAYYMRPDVGKLSIGRTFHAQAGPSDCLFGDLTQEYV
ncbi:MAG: hypothetical protein ACRDHP_14955, partial [Ktedonobacterales bacterium]